MSILLVSALLWLVAAQACQPGYYTTFKGCSPCAAGTYSNGNTNHCTTCPRGEVSPFSPPTTGCTTCPPGSTASSDHTYCNCGAGKYWAASGDGQCHDCAPGTASTGDAVDQCTACSAGSYTSNSGQSTCSKCPKGSFQSQTGQTSCCDCCNGWDSRSSSGSTSCENTQFCNEFPSLCPGVPRTCSISQSGQCPGGPQSTVGMRKRDQPVKCQRGYTQCPRFSGRGGLECVDTMNDPEACGGCIDVGFGNSSGLLFTGTDCTAVPGVSVSECVKGKCGIVSCRKGFVKSLDGRSCTPSSPFKVQKRQTKFSGTL